ncbi:MAG: hypothetical protein M5R40_25915 [Anaerolineae bacterium]|nr:hypothetical protein [Anaerolineae bacterium]
MQLPPFLNFVEGRRTKIEGVGEDEALGSAQGGLRSRVIDCKIIFTRFSP